jgi:exocyst complex component 5
MWKLSNSQTCLSIFTFLVRLHTLAQSTLGASSNLTTFLTEIATGVRTALFDHFKRFQVSAAGGLMITKDLTKYINLLRSWDLDPSFEPSLEVLTEIGNMFVIGPEALKERLRGQNSAVGSLWDRGDMRPYIMRRDDAGSVAIQSVLSTL